MPGPQRVIVSLENGQVILEIITQDKNGNDIVVTDPPNPLRIFIEEGDEAQWECGKGVAAVEVLFNKNGSPFTAESFNTSGEQNGTVQSGIALDQGPDERGASMQYRYSLVITPLEGDVINIDPRVRTYRRFSRRQIMHDTV